MINLANYTNGYDAANEIVKNENNTFFKEAVIFLNRYAEIEEKIGDNDNPFNPDANEIIEIQEEFEKLIGMNL